LSFKVPPIPTETPIEYVLQCDGVGHLEADGVAADLDAARDGYTLSVWVKPAAPAAR
jgi:hypothetical protein